MSNTNVISVLPGTGPAALGKAVDSAAGSTDTGVSILAVRTDTPATITPIAGDYAPLRLNANGSLWVRQEAAASTGSELNLFSAEAVVAADTASATIDITNVNHVTILVKGSDTAATAGFDVAVRQCWRYPVHCPDVQRLSATVPPQLGKSSNQSHSFGICLL